MKIRSKKKQVLLSIIFLSGFIFACRFPLYAATAKPPLTPRDIMTFKSLRGAFISEDGKWVVYHVQPDRGDGEVAVYNIETRKTTLIRPGTNPIMTPDSRWVAAAVEPGQRKPNIAMVLLDTATGKHQAFQDVKSFEFSPDSQWLVYRLNSPDRVQTPDPGTDDSQDKQDKDNEEKKVERKWRARTFTLVLRHLATGREIRSDRVLYYACDPASRYLAYCTYGPEGNGNGLFARNLVNPDAPEKIILSEPKSLFTCLAWSPQKSRLGFLFHRNWRFEPDPHAACKHPQGSSSSAGPGKPLRQTVTIQAPKSPLQGIPMMVDTAKPPRTQNLLVDVWNRGTFKNKDINIANGSSGLYIFDGIAENLRAAVPREKIPAGWMIPADNRLQWTRDSGRLFFGFKPYREYLQTLTRSTKKERVNNENSENNPYGISRLPENPSLDVWHWKDPLLNLHQKKRRERYRKKIYFAVYHFNTNRVVPLADKAIPELQIPDNPRIALGFSETPYLREQSWDYRRSDVFLIDIAAGSRRVRLLAGQRRIDPVSLSPTGRFLVYYRQKHWFLYDTREKNTRILTHALQTPFYHTGYDYPGEAESCGMAGWTKNSRSVLIYDNYDIWEFFTGADATEPYICLTQEKGRKNNLVFRIQNTTSPIDADTPCFKLHQECLVTAYSEKEKYTAFYRVVIGKPGVRELLQGPGKTFRFLQKSEKPGKMIYTRESFDEFPDIWVAEPDFSSPVKISGINPQKEKFLWGRSSLIEWESLEGKPLQGVVIEPENFGKNKRYPLLVICYEQFSHLVHEFPRMAINNFPCLPYYAGHGYVLFLPDIRFETGKPGESAVKCIVPGVKKLIALGIADPDAIGIYGHSWGGYLAVSTISRTNMFSAAAAGAPVANLTSAYNAVRRQSGLSRQFHYEKAQGRMGKSLWEIPALYIRNSPLFSAHKIQTPLLIQVGDNDGVVPWTQGLELYLALRRLNRVCILLQYNDEPHHLKKYANKLDYVIKMKTFLDHYLKGTPAPAWLSDGVPYYQKGAGDRRPSTAEAPPGHLEGFLK